MIEYLLSSLYCSATSQKIKYYVIQLFFVVLGQFYIMKTMTFYLKQLLKCGKCYFQLLISKIQLQRLILQMDREDSLSSQSVIRSDSSKRCIRYFLFVNTKSGNKQGLKYLELGSKKLTYVFGTNLNATVQILDMFDQSRTLEALKLIKKLSDEHVASQSCDIRLMICGGDGTIPWVLKSALDASIDFFKIAIGIVPIGTGNDFSRSVGWGYNTVKFSAEDFGSLHKLVKKWNNAEIGTYDIWDIEIDVFQGGSFYEIKDQNEVKISENKIKKSFTNYFGIGLDARVVYSVQKSRGPNAFINKLLYTLVGARNLFTGMENIEDVIQKFRQGPEKSAEKKQGENPQSVGYIELNQKQLVTEGHTVPQEKLFNLKKGYKGLVCLNCTSYMCGLRNVWMTKKSESQHLKNRERQKFDDGKLQFIAFNNELTLALERLMRTGVRIAQGSGPFHIQFKQKRESNVTYMQIDGESLKVELIKSIEVKRSKVYPNGQIRVLINKTIN